MLTGESASGARVLVTSDKDLDRDLRLAFDETARGVKVKIKRRGTAAPVQWVVRGPRHPHHHSGADENRRPSQHVRRIGQGLAGDRRRWTCTASGGSLDVDAIEGNVDGGTSGGGIRMRDVRGDVVASTSGGSITITDVRGSLRADTSGGGITIDEVGGDSARLDERRQRGRPRRRRARRGQQLRRRRHRPLRAGQLERRRGVLVWRVGPHRARSRRQVSIDASASGGSVNSDVPVTIQGKIEKDSLRGDMNGGGPLLRLRSSGGGVRITARIMRKVKARRAA